MQKKILFTLTLCFILAHAYLANASDYQSPRTAALGGAGRAGPLLNDATYINPSYLAFLGTYSLSLGYQKFSGENTVNARGEDSGYYGRILHASLQDSRTELFKAGIGYTLRQNSKILHVGIAKDFFQRLSFGLGAKILFVNNDTYLDFNYSNTFLFNDWIQLALVVDNILQTAQSRNYNLYRNINIASKFNIMKIMMIYLDPHFTPGLDPQNRFGFNAGIELIPFSDLYFRGGVFHSAPVGFHESAHGNGLAVGAGWVGGRTSIDYSFLRSTRMQKNIPQAISHALSLTLYF